MLKKLFLTIVTISTLSSCATQRLVFDENYQSQPKRLGYKGTSHFVISGWYQRSSFNAAEYCGGSSDNIHSTEVRRSAGQVVIMVLTMGLYSPKEIKIYCKQ